MNKQYTPASKLPVDSEIDGWQNEDMTHKGNETVSVIVPAFNSEKTLADCIDSIINQTYKSIEVIIVNDGSSDGTARICKEYSSNDNRIRVISKDNGGLSSARNCGIACSTGRYIMFVDSDDRLLHNAVEILMNVILAESSDIVVFNSVKTSDGIPLLRQDEFEVPENQSPELYIKQIYKNKIGNYAWSRLYRRSIFVEKKLAFDEDIKFLEDVVFTNMLSRIICKVAYCNKRLYEYRMTESSLCNHQDIEKAKQAMDVALWLEQFDPIDSSLVPYKLGAAVTILLMADSLIPHNIESNAITVRTIIRQEALRIYEKQASTSFLTKLKILLIKLKLYDTLKYIINTWRERSGV